MFYRLELRKQERASTGREQQVPAQLHGSNTQGAHCIPATFGLVKPLGLP